MLVIFDCGKHFNLLQDCGILCDQINSYDNKVLTIGVSGVDEALKILDNIETAGYRPVIYVYDDGKMILDNIEP